jgi:hypothetical protein
VASFPVSLWRIVARLFAPVICGVRNLMYNEITIEHCAASLLWQHTHPNEWPLRWLCSSAEHKQERLDLLKQRFEQWKADELKAKEARERTHHEMGFDKW